MFVEGNTAVRYVEEDSEDDGDVRTPAETIGAPLAITDADRQTADSHTFTLGGTDADSFDIDGGHRPADDQARYDAGLRD